MEHIDSIGQRTSRGHNMMTAHGEPFFPVDPRPSEIDVEVIAHALSMLCRFGGHTLQFYSVAQHSVILSRQVPEAFALEGLLHDAAEAYIGDLVRPLKPHCPDFVKIDKRLDSTIREVFGLPIEMTPTIKQADNRMLWTEKRDLLADSPRVDWGPPVEPYPFKIEPVSPPEAKAMFMARYDELVGNPI